MVMMVEVRVMATMVNVMVAVVMVRVMAAMVNTGPGEGGSWTQ
jgi:hypothetical protein